MRQRRENVSKVIEAHKSIPNKTLNENLSEHANSSELSNSDDEKNEVRIHLKLVSGLNNILYNIYFTIFLIGNRY